MSSIKLTTKSCPSSVYNKAYYKVITFHHSSASRQDKADFITEANYKINESADTLGISEFSFATSSPQAAHK